MKSILRNLIALVLVTLTISVARSQWAEIPTLPVQLSFPMTAQLDGKIYVFGGITGTTPSKSVYVYTPGATDWTKLSVSMPKAKVAGYAAAVNGKIYVMGGGTNLPPSTGVLATTGETYEFDPVANTFTTKAPNPTKVGFFAGAEVGGKIFLIGGSTGMSYQLADANEIQVYDPVANTWVVSPSEPPYNGRFAASTAKDGKIYMMGGLQTGLYSDVAYRGTVNGTNITWEEIAKLPMAFAMASAGTAGGKVVLTGGIGQTTPTDFAYTYAYDDASSEWKPSYMLPIAASRAGQLVGSGNDLYIAGNVTNGRSFKFTIGGTPQPTAIIPVAPALVNLSQNESKELTFTAQNFGIAPLNVQISIPDAAKNWLTTGTPSFSAAPTATESFLLSVAAGSMAPGLYKTTVTLKTNDPAKATINFDVIMYVLGTDIVQQPMKIVMEEGTGDWCGWCPYGHEIVAQLKETHGENFIALQYHGGSATEPFQIPAGVNLYTKLGLAGFPSGAIQRQVFPGQAKAMVYREFWTNYVQTLADASPKAAVSMKVLEYKYDIGTRKVTAKIELQRSHAVINDPATTIRLTSVVTESGIVYPQTRYQPNEVIADYVHKDIVRQMVPNEMGTTANFGPGTVLEGNILAPGGKVTLDVNFTVTDKVEDSKNTNIVFIVSNYTGSTLGPIQQGHEMPLESSVSSVKTSDDASSFTMKSHPNPAIANTTITYSLTERAPVSLVVRDVLGREVARLVSNQMQDAGTYDAGLDVSKLSNGSYFYTLTAGEKSLTGSVLVTR